MAWTQTQSELFGVDPRDWRIPDDQFGVSFFKKLGRGVKKASRAAGKLAKNPLVVTVATGLAFVVPPAGAAIAVGLKGAAIAGQANRIVGAAKSKNPKERAAAKTVVANTQALAKKGDVAAQRGLQALELSAKAGGALQPARPPRKRLVTPGGSKVTPGGAKVRWEVYSDGRIKGLA